jgi:hypothetical protein
VETTKGIGRGGGRTFPQGVNFVMFSNGGGGAKRERITLGAQINYALITN